MIGKKLYYEKSTGDVILITLEKNNLNSVNTTAEQDFNMYEVLQARNVEQVGVIQLAYGEMREDFERSQSVMIDLNSLRPVFEFPLKENSQTEQIKELKANQSFIQEALDFLIMGGM